MNQKELSYQSSVDDLKTSVSNGKSAVASAITDKGVSTSATATFDAMAQNIRSLNIATQYRVIYAMDLQQNTSYISSDIDISDYSREKLQIYIKTKYTKLTNGFGKDISSTPSIFLLPFFSCSYENEAKFLFAGNGSDGIATYYGTVSGSGNIQNTTIRLEVSVLNVTKLSNVFEIVELREYSF